MLLLKDLKMLLIMELKMSNKYIGSSLKDAINEFTKNDPEAQELMEKQKLINSISSSIVTFRQQQGLTQTELASSVNTKQASISRLERGNLNKLPTIEFLSGIAKALNKKLSIRFE
jgi:ribosome-binding protein aMBF1 (putative translation factor)